MSSFKDAKEKTWTIALDAPSIRAVRKECDGLDLAATDYSGYEKLADDPCLLVDVLWVLCRGQAGDGISDAEFGSRLVGDPIESATVALLEAIADFFPKRKRDLALALGKKNRQIRELATDRAVKKINDPELAEKLLAALEQHMDDQLAATLTRLTSATASPDSSESLPAATLSAS